MQVTALKNHPIKRRALSGPAVHNVQEKKPSNKWPRTKLHLKQTERLGRGEENVAITGLLEKEYSEEKSATGKKKTSEGRKTHQEKGDGIADEENGARI